MNLPSKKLFLVFIPVIVILGIFVLAKEPTTDDRQPTTKAGPEVVAVQNSIINETDTDRDGLKDWEETIWKTDPNNPRTYEDYADDSAYVTAQLALMKNSPSGYTGMGPIEDTEGLSEQLFEEYLMLKETGEVTSYDIAQLTNRIRQNIDISETSNLYTVENLKTFSSNNNRSKIQVYAESLQDTVNRYATAYNSQTRGLLATDKEAFNEATEFAADSYVQLSKDLMTLEVPIEIANAHIQYVNSLIGSADGLLMLIDKSDPLKSIAGIQKHLLSQDSQSSSSAEITTFLYQNGIISFSIPFL